MKKALDFKDLSFSTEYTIRSSLGAMENARYFQQITGTILVEGNSEEQNRPAGRLKGVKLLLGEGLNDGWDAYSIFDNEEGTFELGEIIYDYETNDWNEELNKKFDNNLNDPNVLYLYSVEILPEFRGNNVGSRFIKDFILNFAQNCALVVVDIEPFALQTNFDEENVKDSFTRMMNYDKMISNNESITYMLLHYFISIGFHYFPDFK